MKIYVTYILVSTLCARANLTQLRSTYSMPIRLVYDKNIKTIYLPYIRTKKEKTWNAKTTMHWHFAKHCKQLNE